MKTSESELEQIETEGKLRRAVTKLKPVIKRVAKGTAVVCVSLTVNSLGAVANETCNKAGVVAKAAKSAKSTSRRMKKAAEIGTAIVVCTNAGAGVEDIVNNQLSKPYKLIIMGTIFVCGLICGNKLCEGD